MSANSAHNIPADDPIYAECQSCPIPCSKRTAILKKCFCCKSEGFVHQRCARKFLKWTKGTNVFDKKKFTNHLFKYFCNSCFTDKCCFCTKKHNIGEGTSFPVMCHAGHWLIVSKKCAPVLFKGSTRNKVWHCNEHEPSQQSNKEESRENTTEEQSSYHLDPHYILELIGILPVNSEIRRTNHSSIAVNCWASKNEVKPITFFKKIQAKHGFDVVKFYDNVVRPFKKHMDNMNIAERRLKKGDIAERRLDKDFLDDVYALFWENNLYETIISSEYELEYNMSPESLDTLYSLGLEGWLNDEIIGMFYSLLQEYVIIENRDKDKKIPVIYLDSHAHLFMYPQEHQWPHLHFDQLFTELWITNEQNLTFFAKLYKFWFEEKNRKYLGNIFDKLKDVNEVSCQESPFLLTNYSYIFNILT